MAIYSCFILTFSSINFTLGLTDFIWFKISTKTKIENVLQDTKEWILETDGTNLIDILSLDYVDNTRTK